LQQENVRLKEENEALYRYFDTVKDLYWASQQIASEENLLYALNQLLYKVMTVISAKDASLTRLDEETGELVFMLVHGDLAQQLPGHRIKSDVGIVGWVVSNHKPIIVNDPRQDSRFSQTVDEDFGFFTRSIVSVPIMNRGKLIGVIQLLNKRGNQFNEADVALLLIFCQVTVIVLEEIQLRIESGEIQEGEFL
jgi:GAF domain-containing protein